LSASPDSNVSKPHEETKALEAVKTVEKGVPPPAGSSEEKPVKLKEFIFKSGNNF